MLNSRQGKAPGIYELTNDFYRNLPSNWKLYMSVLFNKILLIEAIPMEWAVVVVIMLFKKGDVVNPRNYRPISLVNSITKIFTRILYSRIVT